MLEIESPTPLRAETALDAEPTELTVIEAARTVFVSFRLSQGDPVLQEEELQYAIQLNPHWEYSNGFRDEVMLALTPIVQNLFRRGRHAHLADGASVVPGEISEAVDDFVTKLRERSECEPTELLGSIARKVVGRDYYYLADRSSSRAARNLEVRTGRPSGDRWQSHVCHYGFEGKSKGVEGRSTGSATFDRMYAAIVAELQRCVAGQETAYEAASVSELVTVVEKYLEERPNKAAQHPYPELLQSLEGARIARPVLS